MTDENFRIITGAPLIAALRYNGYKNSTYAIAELVDNSVEAEAKNIQILCKDGLEFVNKYERLRLKELAVLDDGQGMEKKILRRALRFGDTTRNGRKIGKFGMGLPASSFSQCRCFEVYSWTKSPDKALYTYLNFDEIQNGADTVPEPVYKPIPKEWKQAAGKKLKNTGTLVIWKKLDLCTYKTSKGVISNAKQLVGRIYRKYIKEDKLSIGFTTFTEDDGKISNIHSESNIPPNDPLYLMTPSLTPPPFDKKPMFCKYGDKWETNNPVYYKNKKHNVIVRYTIAKDEARKGDSPGNKDHGRHAEDNQGISLVRGKRELVLDDKSLINASSPTERWWSVEIEFLPDLDGFFGITNNKQGAQHFTDHAKNLEKRIAMNEEGPVAMKKLKEEDPDGAEMIMFILKVYNELISMRKSLEIQTKGSRKTRTPGRHDPVERAVDKRKSKHEGESDKDENMTDTKKEEDLVKFLITKRGYSKKEAIDEANVLSHNGKKIVWLEDRLPGDQFFDVGKSAGKIIITINNKHAAYRNLIEVLDKEPKNDNEDNESSKELADRLWLAKNGLKLLIASWARYEDETQNEETKRKLETFRINWGTLLNDFLKENYQESTTSS